jgi:hypothetical protein
MVACIASSAVLELELDQRIGKHRLDTVAGDLACREGPACNPDRLLAPHHLDILFGDAATVSMPKSGKIAPMVDVARGS